MSEDVRPHRKAQITLELNGPKSKDDLEKIKAALEEAGRKHGFTVGKWYTGQQ